MSVLSNNQINERRNKPVEDPASLVVTPLLDSKAIGEDSIDLRLGTNFLMPQIPPQPFIDPNAPDSVTQSYLRLHAPLGDFFVLPAHQTVLGSTLEYLKLPFDVAGQILTKSSVARTFMIIETAPWVHPSYRGCLTLEIANVSNTPILLYPGTAIGQLVLIQAQITSPPAKLSGTYIGPIYPEAPVLHPPSRVLRTIGLIRYRHPQYGWVSEDQMRSQVASELAKLQPAEKMNVTTIVRILLDNGGLPQNGPANDLFR